jgi:hypothetical protein
MGGITTRATLQSGIAFALADRARKLDGQGRDRKA